MDKSPNPKVKCKCAECDKETFKSNIKKDSFGNYKLYCNECFDNIRNKGTCKKISNTIKNKICSSKKKQRVNKNINFDIDKKINNNLKNNNGLNNETNIQDVEYMKPVRNCSQDCIRFFNFIAKMFKTCFKNIHNSCSKNPTNKSEIEITKQKFQKMSEKNSKEVTISVPLENESKKDECDSKELSKNDSLNIKT